MAADPSTALINVGNLAEPAKVFIEKISDAIGGLAAPWQTRRMAEARAYESIVRAKAEIATTDLHRRAAVRWVNEEVQAQINMESVTREAVPLLAENAEPHKMDEDWITNYFAKQRLISDEGMIQLWARILSGEANKSGSFSKRSVNALGEMDKADAELLRSLDRFSWDFDRRVAVILDTEADIYNQVGIDFQTLTHLDAIGLVHFSAQSNLKLTLGEDEESASYYDRKVIFTGNRSKEFWLPVGMVMLTEIGVELCQICRTDPVPGFFEYTLKSWDSRSPGFVVPEG